VITTARPGWLAPNTRLGRGAYLLWGVVLFAVKHNVDRILAARFFGRPWPWLSYVEPLPEVPDGWDAYRFYGVLLLVSLPFITVGVLLTLARLRDAGLSPSLVFLVFVPYVKFLFFAWLALVPSREERIAYRRRRLRHSPWWPDSKIGSAALAILVTELFAMALVRFATGYLRTYGWSLFVGLPFLMGLASVLIASRSRPLGRGEAIGLACLTMLVAGGFLMALAIEGLICLVMALPIVLPLASLGGWVGHLLSGDRDELTLGLKDIGGVVLLFPLLMAGETASLPEPSVYAVTTRVDVAAPPETVWKHVVEFSELPPPTELLFRSGIAYPMRARIHGRGPGAVRFCEFSTGPFIEPIQIWDEPRLLRFAVTQNPPPMEEWTPYRHISPPHLRGFLESQAGQFRLTPLAGGRTRLEGTTWYRHSLWPAAYWKEWSDFVIHRIHTRVLEHIRRQAEAAA